MYKSIFIGLTLTALAAILVISNRGIISRAKCNNHFLTLKKDGTNNVSSNHIDACEEHRKNAQ
jgi:hypothetical protein